MRDPDLAEFLTALFDAIRARQGETAAATAIDRIDAALRDAAPAGAVLAERRSVCNHLPEALAIAAAGPPQTARVATAFAALAPRLAWRSRNASGPNASDNWPDGHANAVVVGRGGLEDRTDVAIGASLLAPKVRYPDHDHAPEEVYLVLTPGRFQHGDSGWFEPGVGGTLYNVPHIRHAMAADETPLLALWCLWIGERPSSAPSSIARSAQNSPRR